MGEFKMPALGADMEAGTVTEWLVDPGDRVRRGDVVAVVDTEKAAIEVEVFEDGVVEEILVPAGERVAVGTPLAMIGEGAAEPEAGERREPEPAPAPVEAPRRAPDHVPASVAVTSPLVRHLAEDLGVDLGAVEGTGDGGRVTRADVERAAGVEPSGARAAPSRAAGAPVPEVESPREKAPGRAEAPAAGNGRLRVSPRARRAAAKHGVDLTAVRGTGPDDSITTEDVERAAAAPPPEPADEAPPTPGADMRTAIARLMARSKREIPHFYLGQDVDMTHTMRWLEEENLRRPVAERLLPAALLLRATALTASEVSEVNGYWQDDGFVEAGEVNLGVAISLRTGGLIVPVIPDAGAKSLDEIMVALRELVPRARKGRLRGSDMTTGTLTVTNLGDQGVDTVYGVIHPPQVALVGFGRIRERPWAAEGMVGARPVLSVTLSADHRAIDGRVGAAFLTSLERHLTEPEQL